MASYIRCKHCGSILKAVPLTASERAKFEKKQPVVSNVKVHGTIVKEVEDAIAEALAGTEYEINAGVVECVGVSFRPNMARGGKLHGVIRVDFSEDSMTDGADIDDYDDNPANDIENILNGIHVPGHVEQTLKVALFDYPGDCAMYQFALVNE